jgi:F0F1-type ATP synthase epsilon subunit
VAEPLRLVVWTPSETLFDIGDVAWIHVELAGAKGLTIWPGHAPLLAETTADVVHYADRSGTHTLNLLPGIVQVEEQTVTILLAGTVDEQAWLQKDERFDRLSNTLLEALTA